MPLRDNENLLDTHIFLGFISGDTRLSDQVRDAIRDRTHEVYLSVVSAAISKGFQEQWHDCG